MSALLAGIPAWVWHLVFLFLHIFVVMNFVLINAAYLTWFERKVLGHIQLRPGPNRVGPFGLLQPIADGIKLLTKEDVIPDKADRPIYLMAPVMALAPVLMAYVVIPFGPETELFGLVRWIAGVLGLEAEKIPLVISDLNIGILYILALSGMAAYGIVLAGWASNSKYALLGGLRSAAQVVSYEIAMGLALIGVLMLSGSLSLVDIVKAQQAYWFILAQPLGFFIFLIAGVAETNRAPFDLPEAESELVAGFHTEYSGMRFALFFMGEYGAMFVISALASILFLGGWLPLQIGFTTGIGPVDAVISGFNAAMAAIPPILWFLAKVYFFLFVYVWLRATFPRFRYDQLMYLGWKVLLPLALVNIAVTGVVLLYV